MGSTIRWNKESLGGVLLGDDLLLRVKSESVSHSVVSDSM